MLTLFFSPGSSSMAVHIALHEIGVNFERQLVSLAKGEQHRPEYLAVNPEAKLATIARRRGWHTEDWSRAPGSRRPLLPMGPLTRSGDDSPRYTRSIVTRTVRSGS